MSEIGVAVPLGTIARIASPSEAPRPQPAAISERFYLQSLSRRLLREERVSHCFRSLRPMHTHIEVYHIPERMSSRFVGLQRCASVWHCPVCASHITEFRRAELARAIEAADRADLAVYMQTLTGAHTRWDDLRLWLDNFNDARRSLTSGKHGTAFLRERFGFVGKITALEVTWSQRNGWHPHCHELLFVPKEANMQNYGEWMRSRWSSVAARHGLSMNVHGYKLDRTYGAVADYVSKFGHEPSRVPWGVDAEMTKSHMKRPRNTESETPFGLLAWSSELPQAAALFQEYARTFKGRHQLQWSQGLRELLGVEERSDESIVEGVDDKLGPLLARLTPAQWRVVLAQDARSEVVQAANTGDAAHFAAVLASLGVEV